MTVMAAPMAYWTTGLPVTLAAITIGTRLAEAVAVSVAVLNALLTSLSVLPSHASAVREAVPAKLFLGTNRILSLAESSKAEADETTGIFVHEVLALGMNCQVPPARPVTPTTATPAETAALSAGK